MKHLDDWGLGLFAAWGVSAMLLGLTIVLSMVGFWLALTGVVIIADATGSVPFAIVAGVCLSRHRRSSEARGARKPRAPIARLR